jgi:hypothetical protein
LQIPFVKRLHGRYEVLGGVPTNYVIDRSGKLVYAQAAAFNADSLSALIVPLLKEPIPEPPPSSALPAAVSQSQPAPRPAPSPIADGGG